MRSVAPIYSFGILNMRNGQFGVVTFALYLVLAWGLHFERERVPLVERIGNVGRGGPASPRGVYSSQTPRRDFKFYTFVRTVSFR